jgi:hypothetical protein
MVVGLLGSFAVAFVTVRTFAPVPVQATATQGQESFAIATGEVDDNVEALYFLDFLTGQLKAAVLNPRNGKFTAFYTYDRVFEDLGINLKEIKNPKFLMVTGVTDMRRGSGVNKLGKGVIYITELTSGKIGAYSIPFNPTMFAALKTINDHLIPLDAVPSRTVAVRPGG